MNSAEPEALPAYQFSELATRPLEGRPNLRDKARCELLERLIFADEAALETAVKHLSKSEAEPWPKRRRALRIAWLLLVAAGSLMGYGLWRERQVASAKWGETPSHETPSQRDSATITSAGEYEDWLVRDSLFLTHVPADYRETCAHLDPDNGAWAFREAIDKMKKVGKTTDPEPLVKTSWWLFEKAARAPRFEIRSAERREPMGPPAGFSELCVYTGIKPPLGRLTPGYLFSPSRKVEYERLRQYPERYFETEFPTGVPARKQAEAKDQKGLRQAIRDWETLCLRLAGQASSRQDLQAVTALIRSGESFLWAAGELGMTAEATRLKAQVRGPQSFLPPVEGHSRSFAPTPGLWMSTPALFACPVGSHHSQADFKAGRMAEYDATERPLVLIAAFVVLMIAIAIDDTPQRGPRVNGLAEGLMPLFDRRDLQWLIGLGVLAPLLWYWAVTRLTPFGGRDLGLPMAESRPMGFQMLASLLLLLILLTETGRWRIARRCAVIGMGPALPWLGWIAAGIAALVVPGAGLIRETPSREQWAAFGACGMALLWLVICCVGYLAAPKSRALEGTLLARLIALPLIVAAALLLASNLFLAGAEKFWMARDPVTGWDAARGCTHSEAAELDAYLEEVRGLFAPPP